MKTEFEFVVADKLPEDALISTPLTFAFVGRNLVLVEKKNGWWDIIGGKIEAGETWVEALKREAREEAGILIDHIRVVGYVAAQNTGDTSGDIFPVENILPVTMSFAQEIYDDSLADDVVRRELFKRSEVGAILNKREDNGQLSEMFDHVVDSYDKRGFTYEFEYVEGETRELDKMPKTQAMVFVKTNKGFLVVRDEGEGHYSLPGGGCYLNESGEECARREVLEEAQCRMGPLKLLGTVIARVQERGYTLSESRHLRYLATATEMGDFIPLKDGLEIAERKEVGIDFLQKNTRVLNNATGMEIVEDLKMKI
ncbi:MAG: NUDIX domain-containing protein [Patescibacteria group bacterium]|nr:NUDIX domain-containing protein [Patescibacteria group bacterium]